MSYKLPLLSPRTIQVPLQPISDTEAIVLGLGRMRGETLRAVVADGEDHLRYSGFEGRQLDRAEPTAKEGTDGRRPQRSRLHVLSLLWQGRSRLTPARSAPAERLGPCPSPLQTFPGLRLRKDSRDACATKVETYRQRPLREYGLHFAF